MKRFLWFPVLCLLCAAILAFAQRDRIAPPPQTTTFEYRSLVPREVAPGSYVQVDWYQVQSMGEQGWELVSVVPWVIHNDERQYKQQGTSRVITQNYLAYYFKKPHQPVR